MFRQVENCNFTESVVDKILLHNTEQQEKTAISGELKFEYEQLRKEILHNDTLNVRTLQANFAITAAIIGLGVFKEGLDYRVVFLFLIGYVLALIGMFQAVGRVSCTFLIASYIRTFIEEKTLFIKWETRLLQLRCSSKYGYDGLVDCHLFTYAFIMIVNCFYGDYYLFLLGKSSNWDSTLKYYYIGGISALWLCITIVSIGIALKKYNKCVRCYDKTFDKLWKEIQSKEMT